MEPILSDLQPRVPAERILVIQFRQIGDVLLSTPVLRALRCSYPQSYIAFLTEPSPGRLLEPLGIRATDLTPTLSYTQREQDEVATFLRAHAITPKEFLVCIDPTHHVPTRQWPGAHFSALVDMLSERLGARVLLLWGPG